MSNTPLDTYLKGLEACIQDYSSLFSYDIANYDPISKLHGYKSALEHIILDLDKWHVKAWNEESNYLEVNMIKRAYECRRTASCFLYKIRREVKRRGEDV